MTVTYGGAGPTRTSTTNGTATMTLPIGVVAGDFLIATATGKCDTEGVVPHT